MSAVQFESVRRSRVPAETIGIIKRMILRGELRAGQRLPPERELAAQLGVSRPSLREAIRALIALNILESKHGHGTFVTTLDPELLAEPIDFVLQVNESTLTALFEARSVLEAGVAGLAAERATDLEVARIEEHARGGRAWLSDVEAFIKHDVQFHDLIREAARSPILSSLLASVSALSLESRWRTAQSPVVRRKAAVDHEAVARAIKSRDPRAAHQAMIDHLAHVKEGLYR